MFVLIIRHAKAEPRALLGSIGKKDATRSLTDAGRRDMRKAAKGLRTLVPEIDVLAASPLVRAQETAAIIAERYDAMPVAELAPLAPGGSKQAVLDWLGDQPDLGILASWLLSGRQESFISLKKGAGCLIELSDRPEAGTGKLVWLLPPAALRQHG